MASQHSHVIASRCIVKRDSCLMLRNHESRGRSQFNVQDRQFNRAMVQYSREKCLRLYEHSIDRDPKVRILWSPRLNDLTNHLNYTSAAQTIGQITEIIAAGVCSNAGLGKDSLPGIAKAIFRELIYTFSLLFRSLVFKKQSLALRISPVMLPETICQIRCVIVVINDSYYYSEALTRQVKETVITRSCDTL